MGCQIMTMRDRSMISSFGTASCPWYEFHAFGCQQDTKSAPVAYKPLTEGAMTLGKERTGLQVFMQSNSDAGPLRNHAIAVQAPA